MGRPPKSKEPWYEDLLYGPVKCMDIVERPDVPGGLLLKPYDWKPRDAADEGERYAMPMGWSNILHREFAFQRLYDRVRLTVPRHPISEVEEVRRFATVFGFLQEDPDGAHVGRPYLAPGEQGEPVLLWLWHVQRMKFLILLWEKLSDYRRPSARAPDLLEHVGRSPGIPADFWREVEYVLKKQGEWEVALDDAYEGPLDDLEDAEDEGPRERQWEASRLMAHRLSRWCPELPQGLYDDPLFPAGRPIVPERQMLAGEYRTRVASPGRSPVYHPRQDGFPYSDGAWQSRPEGAGDPKEVVRRTREALGDIVSRAVRDYTRVHMDPFTGATYPRPLGLLGCVYLHFAREIAGRALERQEVCAGCGRTFVPDRAGQRYCKSDATGKTDGCRQRARTMRKRSPSLDEPGPQALDSPPPSSESP